MQSCFQGISPVRLRKVLPEAEVFGADEFVMLDCVSDVQKVRKGQVFFALRDPTGNAGQDGHRDILEAVRRGASAVVSEEMTDNPFLMNAHDELVPMFLVRDTRSAYARACQALYRWPGRELNMVGITGSSGKTVTAFLTAAVLGAAQSNVGMLGSLGCFDGLDASANAIPNLPPKRTSSWLSRMFQNDCSHAVVEVSSQALALSRLDGMSFETVCLTNLGRAHLAFHRSVQAYLKAKMRIFEYLSPTGVAILNADDPMVADILNWLDIPTLTYGIHAPANVTATVVEQYPSEQTVLLTAGNETCPLRTPIVGNHYIYNCLAAVTIGLRLGVELATVVRGIETVGLIPGRMERLECGQRFRVFVDAAHTPDELSGTLRFLREVTDGRVLCVFGTQETSGAEELRRLGETAARIADRVVFTAANAPGERDPQHAVEELLSGVPKQVRSRVSVTPRRQDAIHEALASARPGDCVLIAGRGQEKYVLNGASRPGSRDDREVARRWLYRRT